MSEFSNIEQLNMLNLALKKEENSYEFYMRAQDMAALSNVRDLFSELSGMELKHKEVLLEYIEKLRTQMADIEAPEDIEDIEEVGFSKYLVSTKLTEETTYQDALIIAMKREERAFTMFQNFYNITKDDDLKNLYKRLMEDEIGHLKMLEDRYDSDVMSDN